VYREEEREMLPLCREEGVGVIPFSPLARGLLAGNRGLDGSGKTVRAKNDSRAHDILAGEKDFEILQVVARIAEKANLTSAQVALAWLFQKPGITAPIIGSTKIHHLEEAVEVLGVELDEDWFAELEDAYTPLPKIDFTNQ
jgi:aryl-alcohol dehydrogenase (NADP+)